MKFQGLHHAAIKTNDLDKTLDFYCGILGLKVEERFYDAGEESDIVFLSLGNTQLEVIAPHRPEEKDITFSPCFHLALATSNVEETYEELRNRGIKFTLPPTQSGGFRYAYFSGPMGETLEIVERIS
ncbi:MAG: glyoxylase family protein [Candidatus Atribacteria bacterium]|nr:glyoxylase family protein [Candidatus Atribacteria bacterium]